MAQKLTYPEVVLARLRYQFCPMCTTQLTRMVINDDDILRVKCTQCDWVHYPTNAMGVNVIVTTEAGVVAILPPNVPKDAPAALPAGHVEYGESPQEAAIRETYEETGLEVEIVQCLGWYFVANAGYPGPMVSFMFETRAVGGELKGSEEGAVKIYPIEAFPQISPNRGGSQKIMSRYLASL